MKYTIETTRTDYMHYEVEAAHIDDAIEKVMRLIALGEIEPIRIVDGEEEFDSCYFAKGVPSEPTNTV